MLTGQRANASEIEAIRSPLLSLFGARINGPAAACQRHLASLEMLAVKDLLQTDDHLEVD